MDFVHVSDPRPAAFEPVNQGELHRWQRDISWTEQTLDASTEIFFPRFPRGTFAVEYDVFATQTGEFTTGVLEVECMYAPEWRGHDENAKVGVR